MKKLIPLLLIVSACSLSYAESMKFITVLSSPVGTFNKLEAVDPAQPAKGNTVNFCTNIGTQGLVELKGTKPAELTRVSLANHATLGKTDEGKYSLNNIMIQHNGSLTGGRLFGNKLTVPHETSGKANNLYGNALTVAGAKTKTLDVNSGASKITAQHDAAEMVWSNEYQEDDACKESAACAKQYLLKSKGSSEVNPPAETSHIECTDTGVSLGGCGAVNEQGEPADYWQAYPLCSEVGGRTGGTFEGECAFIGTCYRTGQITGSRSQLGLDCNSSFDKPKCEDPASYNDCGNFNKMTGSEFEAFVTGKPDDLCKSMCDDSYLNFAGKFRIKGSYKNTCTLYSKMYTISVNKYVLTCTEGQAQVKSEARLMRCVRVAD